MTMPAAANAVESLRNISNRTPREPHETPFYLAKNHTLFDWLKKETVQRRRFDNLMSWRRREILRWYEVFPVAKLTLPTLRSDFSAVLVVDVGGSQGHDILGFRDRYPNLPGRLILEELPETLRSISEPLEGVEAICYDFFTPQPIQGDKLSYDKKQPFDQ